MVVKNYRNVFNWLLVILASTMLIVGASLLLKQILSDRIDTKPARKEDIKNHISIKPMPLPGFTPGQKDDSMDIHFFTPSDMVEDEAMAKSLGIYKVYKSADSRKVIPESYISISFCKKKDKTIDLEKFILGNTESLIQSFPGQETIFGPLRLPKDVVKKFVDMGIPHLGMLYLIDAKDNELICSCTIFFFETPAGFWSINWTAPKKMLTRKSKERNLFLSLIKFTTIG